MASTLDPTVAAMTRVLVVNHAHSEVCGIHDIGKRIHTCLTYSTELEVGYAECASEADCRAAVESWAADVVIVNHRDDLTPWARQAASGPQSACWMAVLHQYEEATADARAAALLTESYGFDLVLALDPQLRPSDPRVHAVGRPIPEAVQHDGQRNVVPTIGSFGFAFPHKGFADVAAEIANQCYRTGLYNLHMPEAFFNGAQGNPLFTEGILVSCERALLNSGVELRHTAEHLAERELVARLAQNDVNCLFYVPGQPDAGLSSAIDYLIAARRPMLVSGAAMFRHAWNRAIWPDVRLGDILDNYDHHQQEADVLYNSLAGQLVRDVEKIVGEL